MLPFDLRPVLSRVHVTNPSQTATLETEFCGQRLSTARAANEPRRRSRRLSRPTAATASRGNVAPFCGGRSRAKPVPPIALAYGSGKSIPAAAGLLGAFGLSRKALLAVALLAVVV